MCQCRTLYPRMLVLRTLIREKEHFRVYLSKLKVDVKVLRRICKIGLPAGLQSCFLSISQVIQSSINSFWLHSHGRKHGCLQYRGLRIQCHERRIPGQPELHQPKRGSRTLQQDK